MSWWMNDSLVDMVDWNYMLSNLVCHAYTCNRINIPSILLHLVLPFWSWNANIISEGMHATIRPGFFYIFLGGVGGGGGASGAR